MICLECSLDVMIIFFLINTILLLKANLDRPLDVSRFVLSFQFDMFS